MEDHVQGLWDLPLGRVSVREVRRGAGRATAVLVHGLGGSSLNWLDLMAELDADLDLLAIDLPGFGSSPPPRDGDLSPSGHGRMVAALIAAWQSGSSASGPVHLFGNSLGGSVCVQVAARRPDLVASMTLVSPALPSAAIGRGNFHLPVVALPVLGEALIRRYAATPARWRVEATLAACFADPTRVPPDLVDEIVREVEAHDLRPYATDAFIGSLRGLMASFTDVSSGRPWALARRTTCPVLAIYGDRDPLVHPRAARRAARIFPDVDVLLVEDCGHAAQMEHPGLVAESWRSSVLARVPLRAGTPGA